MGVKANLTVQKWGNSLAVRIPANIARGLHFNSGTTVELRIQGHELVLREVGEPKLTLQERLARFDPKKHGGEVMAESSIGLEKL
ncbi:MAG: AbrB/MazE/SpoVT family DNA-binding domain-containing protein [Legionellales bacterium]|nr:AbrB/MazE/SpoVT family DNA-binding domain-containing protein [Legionellales bacterium]